MSTVEGRKLVLKYREEGYIYVGGEHTDNAPEHWNYWINCCKAGFKDPQTGKIYQHNPLKTPKHRPRCQCDQPIQYNCWIFNPNNKKIKVIGSECINKFCQFRRTCSDCGCEHKNTKDNYCKDCRKNYCKCGEKLRYKRDGTLFKTCWTCR